MYFFIEMGQGLVRGPDFWVRTSALYSCTFVAGYNSETGLAGAFHYPAGMLPDDENSSNTEQEAAEKQQACAEMDRWANYLQPTRIILVMAKNLGHFPLPGDKFKGTGVAMNDAHSLISWAERRVKDSFSICTAVAAGMVRLGENHFQAGKISDLKLAAGAKLVFDDSKMIKLDQLPEAKDGAQYEKHGGFVLFGKNREKT